MKKKLLFFLCNVMVLSYAGDRFSSAPVSFLDMCTIVNERLENQDQRVFCRLPNKGLLFGVLDGHRSHEVAEHMAQTFPGSFYRYLEKSSEQNAFSKAFCDADEYALNNLKGGSTAAFVYIKNGIAHVANIGDSRAVFGNNKRVVFATQDQTPDRKDECERIMQANGIVYREKGELGASMGPWRINGLAMSRSIGDKYCKGRNSNEFSFCLPRAIVEIHNENTSSFLEQRYTSVAEKLVVVPEIGQVIVQAEYTHVPLTDAHRWLIIASDGLWDRVESEEAMAIVQDYYNEHGCIEGVSTLLSDYAIENGSEDNITVLVIDLLDHIGGKK